VPSDLAGYIALFRESRTAGLRESGDNTRVEMRASGTGDIMK
jgi:hypothetical protein